MMRLITTASTIFEHEAHCLTSSHDMTADLPGTDAGYLPAKSKNHTDAGAWGWEGMKGRVRCRTFAVAIKGEIRSLS